jgi:hypothetical protein
MLEVLNLQTWMKKEVAEEADLQRTSESLREGRGRWLAVRRLAWKKLE